MAPKVIITDVDLVLLRVPVDRHAKYDPSFSDYFIHRVHSSHSESTELYCLPRPGDDRPFGDDNIAILSCCGGNNDDDDGGDGYAVAALEPWFDVKFRLRLYRSSTPNGKKVDEPLRETGNWPLFLNRCPYYCRDIVVNQSRDTIKHVEMEFTMVDSCQDARCSCSYYEWVARQQYRDPQINCLASDAGRSTHGACLCTVTSKHTDTVLHSFTRKIDTYKGKAPMPVESLHTAYPTLSIADDDDVVYLLSKGTRRGSVKMVFTLNMRTRLLKGLVKLHSMSHLGFMRLLPFHRDLQTS
uniref:DUF1618 domain-containing protein n=1 Tax=Oryza punctata TaxID=4537 RepID=A0A0E0L564_ORYPU